MDAWSTLFGIMTGLSIAGSWRAIQLRRAGRAMRLNGLVVKRLGFAGEHPDSASRTLRRINYDLVEYQIFGAGWTIKGRPTHWLFPTPVEQALIEQGREEAHTETR